MSNLLQKLKVLDARAMFLDIRIDVPERDPIRDGIEAEKKEILAQIRSQKDGPDTLTWKRNEVPDPKNARTVAEYKFT